MRQQRSCEANSRHRYDTMRPPPIEAPFSISAAQLRFVHIVHSIAPLRGHEVAVRAAISSQYAAGIWQRHCSDTSIMCRNMRSICRHIMRYMHKEHEHMRSICAMHVHIQRALCARYVHKLRALCACTSCVHYVRSIRTIHHVLGVRAHSTAWIMRTVCTRRKRTSYMHTAHYDAHNHPHSDVCDLCAYDILVGPSAPYNQSHHYLLAVLCRLFIAGIILCRVVLGPLFNTFRPCCVVVIILCVVLCGYIIGAAAKRSFAAKQLGL